MSLGLFSAIGAFAGGSIGTLLASWEQAGFFTYVLPFLLIFAVVFGILAKVKVFGEQKGLNAVVAIAVGLLALQFDFVPIFFGEIFPRLGVGLSVILALFILVGLFLPAQGNTGANWFLFVAGAAIFFFVVSSSFSYLGYQTNFSYWISTYWVSAVTIIVIIAAIGAVIGAKPKGVPAFPPQHWQMPVGK